MHCILIITHLHVTHLLHSQACDTQSNCSLTYQTVAEVFDLQTSVQLRQHDSDFVQGVFFDKETENTLKEEYNYDLRGIYKTVWEIKQRHLVEMAADRGAFIDQSQSFNVHIADPNFGKLTSLHFTAWRSGLKTGMYYLRTRAAAEAIKFTVCNLCPLCPDKRTCLVMASTGLGSVIGHRI
jgi:ribonucleotide reductase alpha subunit